MIFPSVCSSFLGVDLASGEKEELLHVEGNWMPLNSSSPSSSSSSSSLSSSDYEQCLRLHHRELVHGVEANHILDYLFQEQLLTIDDIQLIPSFPIQSSRMRCLLTAIHRRIQSSHPETVFHHFLVSLSDDYSFLERKIRATLDHLLQSSPSHHMIVSRTESDDSSLSENVTTVEADSSLSEVVTVVQIGGDVIEEKKVTLHFPIEESVTLDDANINGRLLPPGEYLRQNEYSKLSPSSEYLRQSDPGKLSPSREQLLNQQTEIVRPLREKSALSQMIPGRQLGVNRTFVPLSMPPSNHARKFKSPFHRNLFDVLSRSVNDQDFDGYDLAKVKFSSKAESDPDTMCLILYLDACKCAIQSDFSTCKRTISHSMDVASLSSNPNRFHVMYLSVRIWVNLKQRRLAKARSALVDALNVIGQDPVTCSGMTAGWIYVDEAKLLAATSSPRHAQSNRMRSIGAMEKALEQFSLDESADGPYGRNFASVKLASLMLACDDRLTWIDVVQPTDDDLTKADQLLDSVDDSVTGICSILKPLFLIALSDRKFRSGNLLRAVQLAVDAVDLASTKDLNEEEDLARLRSSGYGRMLSEKGGGGLAVPSSLELYSSEFLSSSEEADREETDDEGGSGRRRRCREGGAVEGGGCRVRKRKRKRKTIWTGSSSDSKRHLFNINHRQCLPFLLPLLLITLLLLTVALVLCGTNAGPLWGQRHCGPIEPIGPLFGRMAPSLSDDQ